MQTVYGEVILRAMDIEESRIGQLEKVNHMQLQQRWDGPSELQVAPIKEKRPVPVSLHRPINHWLQVVQREGAQLWIEEASMNQR